MSQPSWIVTKAETPRARVRSGVGAARWSNLLSTGNSVSTAFAPGAGAADEVWQPVIALRPDDEIDGLLAAQDLVALGLGDAARDRERQPPVGRALGLEFADLAELGIDLLGRPLADVAGVQHHEIRVLDRRTVSA